MRIAIVSDIHGNWTALEAVLADLRLTAPDLILHAGDLADGGSSPVEVLDCLRSLQWPGVLGNGDEMLFRPSALEAFAAQSKAPPNLWNAVRANADVTRAALGSARLDFLAQLPFVQTRAPLAILHASPDNCWQVPASAAAEAELDSIYSPLGQPIVVCGHTHLPSIRTTPRLTLVNSGSVGLPCDGDPRASYALVDCTSQGAAPAIRRVAYDRERELEALKSSSLPAADWIARMLQSASPHLP